MNERIRDLGTQAGLYVDLNGTPWPRAMSAEDCEAAYKKFAELIVQECCDVLQTETIRHDGYGYNQGALHQKIKQHFGVEESKGWVCTKCGVDRTKAICPLGHAAAITGECPMTAEAQ